MWQCFQSCVSAQAKAAQAQYESAHLYVCALLYLKHIPNISGSVQNFWRSWGVCVVTVSHTDFIAFVSFPSQCSFSYLSSATFPNSGCFRDRKKKKRRKRKCRALGNRNPCFMETCMFTCFCVSANAHLFAVVATALRLFARTRLLICTLCQAEEVAVMCGRKKNDKFSDEQRKKKCGVKGVR